MRYGKVSGEDVARLQGIVGDRYVLSDGEALDRYARDENAAHFSAAPDVVVKPQSTEQVAQILGYADRRRIPVTFRGQGTGLSCGAIPVFGGIVMGIGFGLTERRVLDREQTGKMVNRSWHDYKIPTSLDVPDQMIPIIIEVPQPDGPFGARGVGEHTMIPAAPMIANAVEDALGVRIKSMPVTAEKVALAMMQKEKTL